MKKVQGIMAVGYTSYKADIMLCALYAALLFFLNLNESLVCCVYDRPIFKNH
uniref:Uncharacterized protein n=1 Tax=Anguilla anguilla TaxID=7936 RepID=A0A0E9U1V9_ANGAN